MACPVVSRLLISSSLFPSSCVMSCGVMHVASCHVALCVTHHVVETTKGVNLFERGGALLELFSSQAEAAVHIASVWAYVPINSPSDATIHMYTMKPVLPFYIQYTIIVARIVCSSFRATRRLVFAFCGKSMHSTQEVTATCSSLLFFAAPGSIPSCSCSEVGFCSSCSAFWSPAHMP